MKTNSIKQPFVFLPQLRSAFVAALLIVLFFVPARAQQVFAPPPENLVTPPAAQQYQANEMDVFVPAGGEYFQQQESQPFRWGILNVRPHPYYRLLYGNGIPSGTNQQYSTALNQISPGFLLEIGNHWAFDYTPTWSLYSDSHFHNTLDHSINLSGETAYEDWTFGLSQSCIISADTTAETASQTDEKTFLTALKASYQFNSKISTDMEADQRLVYVDQLQDTHEWSAADWVNYQFWPRLVGAVGAGLGYDNVTGNTTNSSGYDTTFEQFQARLQWRATDKISFQIQGGLDARQFFNGGSGDLFNPIFNALIQYQPFEVTKITITADSKVNASSLSGQSTEITEVRGDISQRLLGRFYLGVNGGYQHVPYIAADNLSQTRADDITFVGVQLSCQFLTRGTKHGTVSVFYQASNDSSSQGGYNYTSNQVGLDIGYRF